MRAFRRHRGWLSGWLIVALLFTQLATAAYACPKSSQGPAGVVMAAMPGCTGHMPVLDPEQPQLCKAHCEAGQQSVNSGSGALDVPAALPPQTLLVRVLDAGDMAVRAAAMPSTREAGPPAGSPPLYLSLQVLRN